MLVLFGNCPLEDDYFSSGFLKEAMHQCGRSEGDIVVQLSYPYAILRSILRRHFGMCMFL